MILQISPLKKAKANFRPDTFSSKSDTFSGKVDIMSEEDPGRVIIRVPRKTSHRCGVLHSAILPTLFRQKLLIMKAALQYMQSFLPDRVHQAMFIIDAP